MPSNINASFSDVAKGYYKTGILAKGRSDPQLDEALEKADTMYSYSAATTLFNPKYSYKILLEGLTRDDTIQRLIPHTTYQTEGDSFHYIGVDSATGFAEILESGAIATGTSSIPALVDVDSIVPATVKVDWKETLQALELAKIQVAPVADAAFIQNYMSALFNDKIEQMLAGVYQSATVHGVDTPATTSTVADVECIDRVVGTDYTESGAGTTHVSAVTDGNIFWGPTNATGTDTARVVRATNSAATLLWDAQVKLPTTAGTEEAYDILSELDTLMAKAKKYRQGTGPANYMALMSDKAMNKIQDELDPKGSYLEGQMEVTQNLNGISTRPGVEGGKLSVASLKICGVKVPCFTSKYLDGTASSTWLWKNSKYTTGGAGNIHLINLDAIELRYLIPPTAETWRNQAPNTSPGLGNVSCIYAMMQLISRNWQSHAALKYIKA